MPIIPVVGRKSPTLRALVILLFMVLTFGAVTMIYPFALMLSTATTGNADSQEFNLIPRYWYDDQELFRKFIYDKAAIATLAVEYGHEHWYTAQDIRPEDFHELAQMSQDALKGIHEDWREFLKATPDDVKQLHFLTHGDANFTILALQPVYFKWLSEKYGGDLNKVNRLYDDTAEEWRELGLPRGYGGGLELNPLDVRNQDWREFVLQQSADHQRVISLNEIAFSEMRNLFGSVEGVNKQKGTSYTSLLDVTWKELSKTDWGRDIQDKLLRSGWPIEQLRLTDAAKESFDAFAAEWKVPFRGEPPTEPQARGVWVQFVRSTDCKPEFLQPIDPLAMWRAYLETKYGTVAKLNEAYDAHYISFDDVHLPNRYVDYYAFLQKKNSLRRDYLLGNFGMVIDFVVLHGDSLINTMILIVCTVATALTINPMAAYVLSRFRLRYAHHILIFLLVTMAFPAEVCMIPGFLLVKNFPIGAICVGAASLLFFILTRMFVVKVRLPMFLNITAAAVVTGVAAYYLPPVIARAFGREDLNVTLMNTFFALVLPGIASGYSIFLLKGFFDSLPPELYEAAMLDGASEVRIFLRITMPLCKPVLAVIALGAYTAAYGEFMFAFLTCQDPGMWTLMVFLYQFQQTYSIPLVMASLVVTAIPTLLVFIFCQGIILRGIVIPTFK